MSHYGNEDDLSMKYPTLEKLVTKLDFSYYLDLYAGQGLSKGYEGTPLRVMKIAKGRGISLNVFLYEKNNENRIYLKKNIEKFRYDKFHKIKKYGERWQDNIKKHLKNIDKNWFVFIDPFRAGNYYNGSININKFLPQILFGGAKVILYYPEYPLIGEKINGEIKNTNILETRDIIIRSKRNYLEKSLRINVGKGYLKERNAHLFVILK